MPVEHLKLIFKFKSSVINKFSKMIDQKVEELICLEDFRDSSSKDTLFELIMMRFDEMKIYKKSLKLILQESKKKTCAYFYNYKKMLLILWIFIYSCLIPTKIDL